ncbi:hypothetical protein CEV32_3794 [Brucella rhizosphaerae]|uniref:Uncharacterized protein n=1 Tax=Brucella rhizosphaerae TaxID=571254 RepID=A0A256FTF5_9HYPH|nr:hypothetical protein CEV32_3794 [Brucella rhizosphaerae]
MDPGSTNCSPQHCGPSNVRSRIRIPDHTSPDIQYPTVSIIRKADAEAGIIR